MVTLQQVEVAQKALKNIAFHTPLMKNTNISHKYGAAVFLKREDLHLVRSHKLRGAYMLKHRLPQSSKRSTTKFVKKRNLVVLCVKLLLNSVVKFSQLLSYKKW